MIFRKVRARFSKSANQTGAAIRAPLLLSLALIAATNGFTRADDFGPRGDVRELRFVAGRLLAERARNAGVDPKTIALPEVAVSANSALLSWDFRTPSRNGLHGIMGLIRRESRWWDALDAVSLSGGRCWDTMVSFPLQTSGAQSGLSPAALASYGFPAALISRFNGLPPCISGAIYDADPHPAILRAGGDESRPRTALSGYGISVHYTPNNSDGNNHFAQLYARPPTEAEIIPYPTTQRFISTSVVYFDLTIDGGKPVTFAPGTTIDIWFPFVLDDTLNYDLTIGFAQGPIGPVYAKPFDNVLHYKLPGFTALPGQTLMAEVDGNWP